VRRIVEECHRDTDRLLAACHTHFRSASVEHPIFPAIDWIVAHCESCASSFASTSPTARSRTSAENCSLVPWLHPLKVRSLRDTRAASDPALSRMGAVDAWFLLGTDPGPTAHSHRLAVFSDPRDAYAENARTAVHHPPARPLHRWFANADRTMRLSSSFHRRVP